jgi:hypothetical protein
MSGKRENSARFGRKTASAISALLTCRTLQQASQVAHIPESTLRRWRARPEFARQLCDVQAEILQGTVNELRAAGCDAAATLGRIARDPKMPVPAQVRACMGIISLLLRAHESEVIIARLTRLEHLSQARTSKEYDDGRRAKTTRRARSSSSTANGRAVQTAMSLLLLNTPSAPGTATGEVRTADIPCEDLDEGRMDGLSRRRSTASSATEEDSRRPWRPRRSGDSMTGRLIHSLWTIDAKTLLNVRFTSNTTNPYP